MSNSLNTDTINAPPRDAATVVLLRDSLPVTEPTSANTAVFEVLLLCRGNSKTVMNNAWVFPGGKLDEADHDEGVSIADTLARPAQVLLHEPGLSSTRAAALFAAACRETCEETGVTLTASQLHPWSRWVTPKDPALMKKRFDARFFLARIPDGQTATHDGVEATDSTWLTPRAALTAYYDRQITLAPPQIMTLASLSQHDSIESCFDYARNNDPHLIEPFVIKGDDRTRTLTYPGDKAHPQQQQTMPGPTRLVWQDGRFEPPGGFAGFFTN